MRNSGFELFEHTADLGLIGHGATLEEALSNVIRGMFSQITDLEQVRPREQREINAGGTDMEIEDLVVDQIEDAISARPSALPFAFFGYQLKGIAQRRAVVALEELRQAAQG